MVKKVEKTQKLKKISYKFSAKENGEVYLKGLYQDDEYEDVPQEINDVLDFYGFMDDESEHFIDSSYPYDVDLSEYFDRITEIVPISVFTQLKKSKAGSNIMFFCHFDECKIAKDKDLMCAMKKAHNFWNKAGRPINGLCLADAMEEVLLKVNKGRV
jgi:hypothetical protein